MVAIAREREELQEKLGTALTRPGLVCTNMWFNFLLVPVGNFMKDAVLYLALLAAGLASRLLFGTVFVPHLMACMLLCT